MSAARRTVWGLVSLFCGAALVTLYAWSDGQLFERLASRGTLWDRLNGAVAVVSMIALALYGGYRAFRSSPRPSNGS